MKPPSVTSELLDRLPPSNLDAEKAALGCILLDARRLDDVHSILRPADFYGAAHATIYASLLGLDRDDQPIEMVGIVAALCAAGVLEEIGGRAYLAELGQSVGAPSYAAHYARIVAGMARLRRIRHAGIALVQAGSDAASNPDDALHAAEAALDAAATEPGDREPVTMREATVRAMAVLDEITARGASLGVPTGLSAYDADQGGLFPGELVILAARPGVGKTSLACQVARHNAASGRLVYFASMEMRAAELSIRIACSEANVSSRKVRTGKLEADDCTALARAQNAMAEWSLDIHDQAGLRLHEIRRQIRRRIRRGLALVVLDYLQLIEPDDRKIPRHEQVGWMTGNLKALAVTYHVPILCLCQLNRQADGEEQPRLSHLRESGSIEQDADVVLFLAPHRPTDEQPNNTSLITAKNRNGETGALPLYWQPERTRFLVEQPYAEFEPYANEWNG